MANENKIKTRVQMKADTAENWSKAEGFTPLAREPIFYTDTGEIKLGDGETNVNELPTFIKDTSKEIDKKLDANGWTNENGTISKYDDETYTGASISIDGFSATRYGGSLTYGSYGITGSVDNSYNGPFEVTDRHIVVDGKELSYPTQSGTLVVDEDIKALDLDNKFAAKLDANGWESNGDDWYKGNARISSSGIYFRSGHDGNVSIDSYGVGFTTGPADGNDPHSITINSEAIENHFFNSVGETERTLAYNYPTQSGTLIVDTQAAGRKTAEGGEVFNDYSGGAEASAEYAHAEGHSTVARGYASHAEGEDTGTQGIGSHSEGQMSYANGDASHAEGFGTYTSNTGAHSEGIETLASGNGSHAEGKSTNATGPRAHSEGEGTEATAICTHAEGAYTHATAEAAHAEGKNTHATGTHSHAEGLETKAQGVRAHSEGYLTEVTTAGGNGHVEGYKAKVNANNAHAEGNGTLAEGEGSHTEGQGAHTTSTGKNGHAEGTNTTVSNEAGHAEGKGTTAAGYASHAEGDGSSTEGSAAHAEGKSTKAIGSRAHSEGEGTEARAMCSHAEGAYTIATAQIQHVEGKFNVPDEVDTSGNGNYVHITGWGTSDKDRKNIYTLDTKGNGIFAGNVFDPDGILAAENRVLELIYGNALAGKTVFGFGDSLMFGHGPENDFQYGMLQNFVEKYGINFVNYSEPGAVLVGNEVLEEVGILNQKENGNGTKYAYPASGKSRLIEQIEDATGDPDFIIFDILVNDIWSYGAEKDNGWNRRCPLGGIYSSYNPVHYTKGTFCGEFETCLAKLSEKFPRAIKIFVTPHKMKTRSGTGMYQCVDMARYAINTKWNGHDGQIFMLADIYANNPTIPSAYWTGTAKSEKDDYGTHLTSAGYDAYYIPTIHIQMMTGLNKTFKALENRVTRLETAFNSITIGGSY